MGDVIQNVRVRIMGDDMLSPVFARAQSSVGRALSQINATVASFADRMTAESAKAMAGVVQSQSQLGPAVRNVINQALTEAKRLSQNKDVRLVVEIAKEKLDESKIRLKQWVDQATRSSRIKVAVAVEAAREGIDEARIKLRQMLVPLVAAAKVRIQPFVAPIAAAASSARQRIQVPIDIARDKVRTSLQRIELEVYNWKLAMSQKPGVKIAFAVASSVKNIGAEAGKVLGPLRQVAGQGIRFVFTASAAGVARAASAGLGAIRGLVSGAGSLISGMAASAISALGPLMAILLPLGVFAGFATLAKNAASAADANAKLADRLGATVEGLTALQYAADTSGTSADALDAGIKKMTQTVGDAIAGSKAAGVAFDSLGLSAEDLAKMPADQAFIKIADELQKLPTAAQKASAAADIFGKSGADLLPLLNQGAGGIAKARAEAERMGLIISRVDSAKIELANDAIARVGNTIKGYVLQAVVQLAPYIEAVSQKIYSIMPTGQQVADFVINAIEWVVTAIAKAADWLELFKAGWYLLEATVLAVGGGVLKAIDLIGSGLVKLINLLPGVELEWTDTFSVMADSMADDVIKATDKASASFGKFNDGTNATAVKKTFDEIRVAADAAAKAAADKANALADIQKNANGLGDEGSVAAKNAQKLSEELKKLADDAATAGLSDLQKKMRELTELGMNPAEAAAASLSLQTQQTIQDLVGSIQGAGDPWAAWKKGLDVLDQLKAAGQITAEQFDAIRATLNKGIEDANKDTASKVRESLQSPLDKANDQIREAFQAMFSGAISSEEFDAYAKKILDGVQDKAKSVEIKFASGKDQGLKTGFAEATKERLAMLSPMKSVDVTAKKILAELQSQGKSGGKSPATVTSS